MGHRSKKIGYHGRACQRLVKLILQRQADRQSIQNAKRRLNEILRLGGSLQLGRWRIWHDLTRKQIHLQYRTSLHQHPLAMLIDLAETFAGSGATNWFWVKCKLCGRPITRFEVLRTRELACMSCRRERERKRYAARKKQQRKN